MKLLITAIGKRVQLIKYLRKSFEVIGTDCSDLAPALYFVDKFYKVSRYDAVEYRSELLDICSKEKVDILIPLFEKEFETLDAIREQLMRTGTFLMLSDKAVLSVCNDKWKTYEFFVDNQICTPQSYLSIDNCPKNFPLFIKPRVGMGSKDSIKVNSMEELEFYFYRIEDPIVQEFVEGVEYTMDCVCDVKGNPVIIVPRERLEVRAGEVTKSKTCKDENLKKATKYVCEKLKAMGPITIQCIKTPEGEFKFTEINPRLGGGVPLAIEAGADYCGYFKALALGKDICPDVDNFKELIMLRYDEAVYI